MYHLRSHPSSLPKHSGLLHTQGIPEDEEIAVMSDDIAVDRFYLSDPRFSLDDLDSVDVLARTRRKNAKKKGTRHSPFEVSRYRVLDTVSVLAICFFCVCGGPLGPDQIIANDPVTGTISLVLFPMLCTAPFAYIIAELCSALPEDGGHVMWVLNAFGPFMAFQEGYWAWLAGIFSRVLRVGLLYEVIATACGWHLSTTAAYAVKAGATILLSLPSFLGARVLSKTLLACLVLCVVLPFAVLTAWGFSQATLVNHVYIKTATDEKTDWVQLTNTLFWSSNGFYLTSTFGGRVFNPARAFPHAIYLTYLIIVMFYLLPLLATYSATRKHWLVMEDKHFVALARTIGGSFLHSVIVFATACGLAGMYMAQVFCEGYQVSGMAEAGLAPELMKKHSRKFDAPYISLFFSLVVTLVVSIFEIKDLLQITNTFAALVQILIIFAALELRRSLPYMPRPAKLPGGMPLMFVLSVLPLAVLCYIVAETFKKPFTAALCGGLVAFGLLFCARTAVASGWKMLRRVRNRSRRNGRPTY